MNLPLRFLLPAVLFAFATGCANNDYGDGIFSYSKDRCLGSHNQCRNECASAPDPAVESACVQRCLSRQSQCYATGDDGRGSTLAEESLIGHLRTKEEKEAAFRQYKARKARERAEAAAEGHDPYANSEIVEIIPADPGSDQSQDNVE